MVRLPNSGASSFQMPSSIRCKVLSLKCLVATSATVGNRFFVMVIRDKSGEIKLVIGLPSTMAASQNTFVSLAPGLGGTYGVVVHHQSIPDETILEVDDLISFYDSQDISTADRITDVVAVVELL